jgi:hypothetical protein
MFISISSREIYIVFLKDNDPSGKKFVELLSTEQVLHGVGVFYDLGS